LKRGRTRKKAIVNTKVIYAAAGGIAVAAIAIFFIMGIGNFRPLGNSETPGTSQTPIADLQLELRDIVVEKTDEENATVQVVFDIHNPNRSTAILETIHYTLDVGQYQMTTGDVGVTPEGFVSGQEDIFPIVGSSTVTLKDTKVAVRNNLTASSWDSMVNGTGQYNVEGIYSYRLTGSNFQTSYFEKGFTLTFP
ncbi:MAG TPA: hypothetical protein VFR94_11880, partial [Nitrososphaeraceae archaeon]|nr:hypothetical protein [Nitrososphaeraceae archaeon]